LSPNYSVSENVDLKLAPARLKQLELAMTAIEEHVGKLSGVWREVSEETKRTVTERSPILSRFLTLAENVL